MEGAKDNSSKNSKGRAKKEKGATNFLELTELTLGNKCIRLPFLVGSGQVCRDLFGYPVVFNNFDDQFQEFFCCPESSLDIDELGKVCTEIEGDGPAFNGCRSLFPLGTIGAGINLETAMTGGNPMSLCCKSDP